jgi:hypothetical protein
VERRAHGITESHGARLEKLLLHLIPYSAANNLRADPDRRSRLHSIAGVRDLRSVLGRRDRRRSIADQCLFESPWEVRDDAIALVLDPSPASADAFLARHCRGEVPSGERRA